MVPSPTVFWDTDIKQIDFDKQSDFVISRILEHGHLRDVKWMLKKYSAGQIKKAICQARDLSKKTVNFWSMYFKIPQNKIRCLQKPYLKKQSHFWPH